MIDLHQHVPEIPPWRYRCVGSNTKGKPKHPVLADDAAFVWGRIRFRRLFLDGEKVYRLERPDDQVGGSW